MPDVLADQVVAHGVHQVPAFQVAEPVQEFGHAQRHGGLAGARRAGEAHVQVWPGGLEAESLQSRSTRSSSAMSSIHRFTGTRPTRSRSSAPSTSSMLAASRSSANMTRASGKSGHAAGRAGRSRLPAHAARANDPGAGWAAGRRMGVLDIPRRPKAGIMGAISRCRPGSIRLESQSDSGLKPRDSRLSGLVWCHPFRSIQGYQHEPDNEAGDDLEPQMAQPQPAHQQGS